MSIISHSVYPLVLLFLAAPTYANTEIVNFSRSSLIPAGIEPTWSTRAQVGHAAQLILEPAAEASDAHCCTEDMPAAPTSKRSHSLWLSYDMDRQNFDAYTIRLSWPASHPTEFRIRPYEGCENSAKSGCDDDANLLYVHVTAVTTGVRPYSALSIASEAVPFHILLEPLRLSVVPASLIPFLFLLVFVVVLAYFSFRRVIPHFEHMSTQARHELLAAIPTDKKTS